MSNHRKARPFASVAEVADLVAEFEAGTLPRSEWDHRAHLTVALWYMAVHDEAEASRRMISGIRRYNHAKGIDVSPRGGYHETITLFWLAVVCGHLQSPARAGVDFLDVVNDLLAQMGPKPGLVFEFYSPDRLWSPEARTAWLAPDLKPLDELCPPES